MNKRIVGAIASAAVLGGLALASPATAAPQAQNATQSVAVASQAAAPAVASKVVGQVVAQIPRGTDRIEGTIPFTTWRYLFKDVCLHDNLSNPAYNVGWTGNSWESGDATVRTGYRTAAQGCADFPAWQRLRFYFYSVDDGMCGKVTGTRTTATDPVNPYYNQVWTGTDGGPAIWVNQYYYSGCRDTSTRISNNLARSEGFVFGLNGYTDCGDTTASTRSVMNLCNAEQYIVAGAWAKDRSRLYEKMNPS